MSRSRFCRVCRQFHDLEAPWPAACDGHFGERPAGAPHVITDTIEVRGMHDGQMYTSKSKLRSSYRAHGVEEMGTSAPTEPKPFVASRDDIKHELRNVYRDYSH